jgi:general secretion pathway protein J
MDSRLRGNDENRNMPASAQHGFMLSRRSAQQGFTLIELLVALLIFAMLSLAGVALLRGSVSAQAGVRDHLDRLADVQVAMAAIEADLAQATVRISRTQAGTLAPAFFAGGTGKDAPVLQLIRMGWSNPGDATRPSVQKVEYWWREGRLERVGYPQIDGAVPPDPAVLLADVTALDLRFRNKRGEWLPDWRPAQPDLLPVLVEMTVTRRDRPPLTLRFLVGPGGKEKEAEPEQAAPALGSVSG